MRIPLTKVYRAFPELDRFSEAQCDLLMCRVRLDPGTRDLPWAGPAVVFLGSLLIVALLLARTSLLAGTEWLFRDADVLIALLSVLGIPPFSALLIRDCLLRLLLLRAVRVRIDRVRCRHCKYILIGQRPLGDLVTCPECGRTNRLRELGVTADDLIPPESEVESLSSEGRADQESA